MADAPKAEIPLASAGSDRRQSYAPPPAREIGQDLSDRPLAHIVTGGLSGRAV